MMKQLIIETLIPPPPKKAFSFYKGKCRLLQISWVPLAVRQHCFKINGSNQVNISIIQKFLCMCLNNPSKEHKRQDIYVPRGIKSLLTLRHTHTHTHTNCTLVTTVDQPWRVPRDQHLPEHPIITLQINRYAFQPLPHSQTEHA